MTPGYYWLTKAYSRPEIILVQGELNGKLFYEIAGRKGVFFIELATTAWKVEGPITYGN